ncbi:helix-turn-helix domain-containing protein [Thalassobacillus devorans]|uniref:helix-turn-helix domain-containing protein n=1 Tax=Thalassobacillus devorans TaxID=279813 RepID=UPI00048EDFB7|nr:helix-turn-helix domain-containing protein [Thalassobacillus devorans]
MKKTRKGINKTQQQLAIDMLQSREYISKQERGERKIPPVTTKYFIEKYNSPWLALEAVNEYIGWGITQLDSPRANSDKYFLQLLLEKELLEALETIAQVTWTKDIDYVHSMELQDIHRSAETMASVVHFSTLYLASLCETYNISWLRVWRKHHSDLKTLGYHF